MTVSLLLAVTLWGFGIASLAYAVLAVWLIHRDGRHAPKMQVMLTGALMMMSVSCIAMVVTPRGSVLADSMEVLRNGGWLAFMAMLLYSNDRTRGGAAGYIYLVLSIVLAFELILLLATPGSMLGTLGNYAPLATLHFLLRMIFAVGALVLVHDLYTALDSDARWGVSLPLAALAAIWGYDLNLYTIAYLAHEVSAELVAARGFAMAALVPVLALGTNRNRKWRVRLSRKAAFQSASLMVIGGYLLLMLAASLLINFIGGDYARLAQISLLFVMFVGALLIMPSGKFRAWMRVWLAKNFYQHRYDYRDEWMRFTDTISHKRGSGEGNGEEGLLENRVIKAVADICDCPEGLLLVPDNSGRLRIGARWNWGKDELPARLLPEGIVTAFEQSGYIVDLDAMRVGSLHRRNLPNCRVGLCKIQRRGC